MTIQERIERSKTDFSSFSELKRLLRYKPFLFTESELTQLLQQVAKEQREICAKSWRGSKYIDERVQDRIRNAPSPLDKEEA